MERYAAALGVAVEALDAVADSGSIRLKYEAKEALRQIRGEEKTT